MSLKTIAAAFAATATAVLLATGAASAAQATTSVNVRSGPGTSFGVVDTLFAGETVEIGECRSSGFCFVTHSGPDGWVSSRYLTQDRASRDDRDDRDDRPTRAQPEVSFSFSFGRGNGFSIGNGRPGTRDEQVCLVTFFERSQVAGGADADVQRARVLPRAEAERLDRPNDRQAIFDYGNNRQTRETCNYLDRLN